VEKVFASLQTCDEYQIITSVLLKKQLKRKPFYRKAKELVRDLGLFMDSQYLTNMRAEFRDFRKWKFGIDETICVKVHESCPCIFQCLEHLKSVICKFGLQIFALVLKAHYPALFLILSGALGTLFCQIVNIQNFLCKIQVQMMLLFPLCFPESKQVLLKSSLEMQQIDESNFNERRFLEFLSFGRSEMLPHEEDLDSDEEDEEAVPAGGAAQIDPKLLEKVQWKDDKKVRSSKPLEKTEISNWISGKKRAKVEAAEEEGEEPIVSNSFFAEFEKAEKKQKKEKQKKRKMPKNISSVPKAAPKKSSVSKSDFMNSLLSKK
jgi:hypothetical protein